jgi:hypothetical protein
MHLLPISYTTTSTRKRKSKDISITDKVIKDFKEYNKLMRKYGSKELTMEDYLLYRRGKLKAKLKGVSVPKYQTSNHKDKYPSGDGVGTAYAKPEKVYTGNLVKGIAVTHKSNLVPVINQEQMEEISKMRR